MAEPQNLQVMSPSQLAGMGSQEQTSIEDGTSEPSSPTKKSRSDQSDQPSGAPLLTIYGQNPQQVQVVPLDVPVFPDNAEGNLMPQTLDIHRVKPYGPLKPRGNPKAALPPNTPERTNLRNEVQRLKDSLQHVQLEAEAEIQAAREAAAAKSTDP